MDSAVALAVLPEPLMFSRRSTGGESGCSRWSGSIDLASLLYAAALPWYAVGSGTFGMYFFLLLAAVWVGRVVPGPVGDGLSDVIFVFMVGAVLPLAALLLLALPAGLTWTLFRGPPAGLFGYVVRTACLISMFFSSVYFAIILGIIASALIVGEPASEPGHGYRIPAWWPFVNLVVLPVGLAATWRSWRLLRHVRQPMGPSL